MSTLFIMIGIAMTLNKHTWMIGMALFFIGTTKQRKGNGTDNQRSKEAKNTQ